MVGWIYQQTLISLAILLFTLSNKVHGGKILVYPLDGSHWVNMKFIIEALYSKGHDITVVRASNSWYIKENSHLYNSITIPNTGGFDENFFGEFILSKYLKIQREGRNSFWTQITLQSLVSKSFYEFHKNMAEVISRLLDDDQLMRSLQDAKFDLVLTDPSVAVGTILARRLGLPLVHNVRWTIQGEAHMILAPTPLSYVPFTASELTDKMSFPQRIFNIIAYFMGNYNMACMTESHYKAVVWHHFGPDVDYDTFFREADIWLMRTDFVFDFPRPTMPNMVYVSGFQCRPAQPLPPDLERFVQSSGEHGVIMMTLGTLLARLPEDIADEIAATFALLPQKVIWRYTGPTPSTLGNNTLLVDWIPQNDLLGHPKTRVFVAHGGTNGVQEAIYHGVPLVGLPLVLDQPDNLSKLKARGAATVVNIVTMDRGVFREALEAVLYEPSYTENIQRLSALHRDQPMKPLDKAVFWIEFVMRHKGARHLRTESYKMSWVVYHSVDVIGTLLACVLLVALVSLCVMRWVCHKVFCKRKVKTE
ncbi:UDP-glucuronosyltransferase 2A1 [Esox lucius]|uniref:UDP-glucuronosyltransferase n=1 Tax=Esox lucius TaxID=8010 RepID=A0A3P8XL92_ESOLU|nr:UDP-glucuronosyltransferase 2A1 [Esox lucius]XP_019896023.2 UDP-glucuronosyltransferase 2A1 [Esox lucius]